MGVGTCEFCLSVNGSFFFLRFSIDLQKMARELGFILGSAKADLSRAVSYGSLCTGIFCRICVQSREGCRNNFNRCSRDRLRLCGDAEEGSGKWPGIAAVK